MGTTVSDPATIMQGALAGKLSAPRGQAPTAPVDLPPWAGGAPAPPPPPSGPAAIMTAAIHGTLNAPAPDAARDYSTPSGVLSQFLVGPYRAVTAAEGVLPDVAQGGINLGIRGVNTVLGTHVPQLSGSVGTAEWLATHGPNVPPPAGEPERIAAATGSALGSLPVMAAGGAAMEAAAPALAEAGGAALPEAARPAAAAAGRLAGAVGSGVRGMPMAGAAVPVAAGAAAGQGLADAMPPQYAGLADIAGNLLGGGVAAGGQALAGAGARAIVQRAGMLGIGAKETIPVPGGASIRATGPQLQAAARQLYQAGGEPLRTALAQDPLENTLKALTARLNTPAAKNDPALRDELQGRAQAIQAAMAQRGSEYEVVPGDRPTLPQVAPLPGVIQGAKAAAMRPNEETGGPAFIARAAEQNAARIAHLEGQDIRGASPAELGDFVVSQLRNLEGHAAQTAAADQEAVRNQTNAMGGHRTPAQYGSAFRGALEGENAKQHAAESHLWDAIDPNDSLAMSVKNVRVTARQILQEVQPKFGGALEPEENGVLHAAAALPNVVKFSGARVLLSNIAAAQRALRVRLGNDSVPMRRLSQLKDSVYTALAGGVEDQAEQDVKGVASRAVTPDQTAHARIMAWQDEWARRRSAEGISAHDSGSGGKNSAGGSGAVSGLHGAESNPGTGRGDSGVSPGVPPPPPLVPNLDEAAVERAAAARAATVQRKSTFRSGEIGEILAPGARSGEYRLRNDADVARKIFSGSAKEPEVVSRYIAAVGGRPKAVALGQDYLVSEMRREGVINPDGMIDPTKLPAWSKRHTETLKLFPELQGSIGSAAAAQETANRTMVQLRAGIQQFKDSAARRFLGGRDPGIAVGEALGTKNSAENLNDLIDMVHGHGDAEDSLKHHVVQFMLDRFAPVGRATATTENATLPNLTDRSMIAANQFKAWVAANKRPLRRLFGGQGIQNFEMVSAAARRGQLRGEAIPGSQTAPNMINAAHRGIRGVASEKGVSMTVIAILGEMIGEHLASTPLVGAGAGVLGKVLMDRFGAAGAETVKDVLGAAYLHPEVARTMMVRIPANGQVGSIAAKKIGSSLQSALLADAAGQQATPREKQ